MSTHPPNHKTKAAAVRDTWGRRCDRIIFVSNEEGKHKDSCISVRYDCHFSKMSENCLIFHADPNLPAISVEAKSDYHGLWAKTKAAFRHIHKHHLLVFVQTISKTQYVTIFDRIVQFMQG